MSVSRFNYTERRRISQSDAVITIDASRVPARFEANLDLSAYKLPLDASVVVEAYRQTSVRRFSFGSVGRPQPTGSTELSGLPEPDILLFRVKVIDDKEGSGRLLAEADRVRPIDPDKGDRPSLVAVREADLSGELWRLTVEDDHPVLLLERRYGPREVLLSSPHFRWLVLPQLFRELLRGALYEYDADDAEAGEDWRTRIIAQAKELSGEPVPNEEGDGAEEWITSAVRGFCRRHGFAHRHANDLFGGQQQ